MLKTKNIVFATIAVLAFPAAAHADWYYPHSHFAYFYPQPRPVYYIEQPQSIYVNQPVYYAQPPIAQNTYCREFTRTILIGNRWQQGYGNACLQPDGSWQLVN